MPWRKPGAWLKECCSKALLDNLRYSQQAGCVARTEGCILTSPPKYLILKNIFVISALLVCVCGLFCARPAQAQIYSWKDANGIMVLSNVPGGGAAATLHGLIAGRSAQKGRQIVLPKSIHDAENPGVPTENGPARIAERRPQIPSGGLANGFHRG